MRQILLILALVSLSLIFMGCLWQVEISIINTMNGWPFVYVFCLVQLDNWVARDIFYCVFFSCFLLAIFLGYLLGKNGG